MQCALLLTALQRKNYFLTSMKATSKTLLVPLKNHLNHATFLSLHVCSQLILFSLLSMNRGMEFLWVCLSIISTLQLSQATGIMDNVIFAVNCGGEAHTDKNGRTRTRKFQLIQVVFICV